MLQHVAHEGPGAIAEALLSAGYDMQLGRVDECGLIPGAEDLDNMTGLIVLGGPMGVHDEDEHPWLAQERALMAMAVEAGLPVLGICLGAQQLAAALGGMITTGPEPEIGVGEVILTRQAADDPVFGPAPTPLPCLHWHGDTFSLPHGAELLAWNETYLHQAFRFGDRAYGLQFHVEVTPTLVDHWAPHLPPDVSISPEDAAHISAEGLALLERFIALAH